MNDPVVVVLSALSAGCWGAVAGGLAFRSPVPQVGVMMTAALCGIMNVGTTGLAAGLAMGGGVEVVGVALFALFALSWLGALIGVGFGVTFIPVVAFGRAVEERPSLDALPHVTLAAATWLTALVGAIASLSPPRPVFGLAALALGIAMVATSWSLVRDRQWTRWLRRVHGGQAGRWAVVGQDQVQSSMWLVPLLRGLTGACPDRVLAHHDIPVGDGPFRGHQELAPVALVHGSGDRTRSWAHVRPLLAAALVVAQAALLGVCAARLGIF